MTLSAKDWAARLSANADMLTENSRVPELLATLKVDVLTVAEARALASLLLVQDEALEAAEKALILSIGTIYMAETATGDCCCGDNMEQHSDPMNCGHAPVDAGEYHAHLTDEAARAAIAAIRSVRSGGGAG